jgi:hypothetical protein
MRSTARRSGPRRACATLLVSVGASARSSADLSDSPDPQLQVATSSVATHAFILPELPRQLGVVVQARVGRYAQSRTEFDLRTVEVGVTFVIDPNGQASALVVHQGGAERRAERVQ